MISVRGSAFVDGHGRTLMLRGANLGGSSKVPTAPDGATHLPGSLRGHRAVSFVGRPFPLDQADEHFGRLARWGLSFLRLVVTWEAVEHAGPGIYDEEYLAYLREVAARAGAHGISLVVDPHQDVWSRFCGGDGAPGWTLEAAGFDLARLEQAGAAITHQSRGDPFPRMLWPTNGARLAAATMFTLFFGGGSFAPRAAMEGEPAQEFLQRHYIGAVCRVARALSGLPNVAGYGTMNEPLPGYIGCPDLASAWGRVTLDESPTPLQGMALGEGIPQEVAVWELGAFRFRRRGTRLVNTGRVRAWQDARQCPWQANGVWGVYGGGKPVLLRPDHFRQLAGKTVDFAQDFCRPFILRLAREVRRADPRAAIFVESEAFRWPPALPPAELPGAVFSPHWYDGIPVATKRHIPFLGWDERTARVVAGRRAVRRSLAAQLAHLRQGARERMGGAPVLLGEFGIPFDLHGARAGGTAGARVRAAALERSFRAVEENLLSCTIWNYAADNSPAHGDGWNGEDFSIYSRGHGDEAAGPDAGGRGLRALVRPYPRATSGTPLELSFHPGRREFRYRFAHDPAVQAPTEIFVPALQYPGGVRVEVSDGTWEQPPGRQALLYRHGTGRCEHTVRLTPVRAGA